MEPIPIALARASAGAVDLLDRTARDVARAGADGDGTAVTARVAGAARAAIFADALLAATHARLEALKSVAR